MEPAQAPASAPRRRLSPEVRVQQILDAALVEFCERGYGDTRMDDIARRAGLSKGGLYAHFDSKDAVIEALLRRSLAMPSLEGMPEPDARVPTREFAAWLVDRLYAQIADPAGLRVLWLMIAERERVGHLLELWDRQVIGPYEAVLQRALAAREAAGATPSVLSRAPWLALSPLIHATMRELVIRAPGAAEMAQWRQAHEDLLVELLDPASRLAR